MSQRRIIRICLIAVVLLCVLYGKVSGFGTKPYAPELHGDHFLRSDQCLGPGAGFFRKMTAIGVSEAAAGSPDCPAKTCSCITLGGESEAEAKQVIRIACVTPTQLRCHCGNSSHCLFTDGALILSIGACDRLRLRSATLSLETLELSLQSLPLASLDAVVERCDIRMELERFRNRGCSAIRSEFSARTLARDCLAAEYDELCLGEQPLWSNEGPECGALFAYEQQEEALSLTAACFEAICPGEEGEEVKALECTERVCEAKTPELVRESCTEYQKFYTDLLGLCVGV